MTLHALDPQPRATLDGDCVRIRDLDVRSAEVVSAVTRHAERSPGGDVSGHVLTLLEVGAKAVAVAGSTVDVEEIRRNLTTFTADVAMTAQTAVDAIRAAVEGATDVETGAVAVTVHDALATFAAELNAAVAGEDAPLRMTVEKTVKAVTDKALGEVQRALTAQSDTLRSALATDNPNSPINALKVELLRSSHETRRELAEALGEVRTLIEVGRAQKATMEKTAIKGLVFEDAAVQALLPIAIAAGDTLEPTGSSVGAIARCKNGDAVVSLSATTARRHAIRLAVEVKAKSLTCDGWKAELEAARRNRDAVAALGIARTVTGVPGGRRVLVLDPLNVVVAFDPETDDSDIITAAYHLLRAQAACVVLEGESDELDTASIRARLASAIEDVDRLGKIDRAAGSARKSLDEIVEVAHRAREAVDNHVRAALLLIEGAP